MEMIDTAEFAKRMNIPLTEARRAIRTGQLKPGRHYVVIGTAVRFSWGEALIDKLFEDSALGAKKAESHGTTALPPANHRNTRAGINKDYFSRRK